MPEEMSETYAKLAEAIEWGDEESTAQYAQRALEEGHDPADVIQASMSLGVRRAGERFNQGEFFLPELMLAGEAMKAGLAIVMPQVMQSIAGLQAKGKILLGTVEGDVHDIGKNICVSLLSAQGYQVVDMGVDNDQDWILKTIDQEKPHIVGLGSYMTTTMVRIPPTFERIRKEGLAKGRYLLAGGVAVNRRWATEVAKADGYAEDAWELIDLVGELLGTGDEPPAPDVSYGRGGRLKVR